MKTWQGVEKLTAVRPHSARPPSPALFSELCTSVHHILGRARATGAMVGPSLPAGVLAGATYRPPSVSTHPVFSQPKLFPRLRPSQQEVRHHAQALILSNAYSRKVWASRLSPALPLVRFDFSPLVCIASLLFAPCLWSAGDQSPPPSSLHHTPSPLHHTHSTRKVCTDRRIPDIFVSVAVFFPLRWYVQLRRDAPTPRFSTHFPFLACPAPSSQPSQLPIYPTLHAPGHLRRSTPSPAFPFPPDPGLPVASGATRDKYI